MDITKDLIEALISQRNTAMDQVAHAMARSVGYQKENAALLSRVAELEKEKETKWAA